MHIGVEVSILRGERRGVGNYLLNLLQKLSTISFNETFYLYSPKLIRYKLFMNKNWHWRTGNLSMPGSLWLQTQCRTFVKKDRIDVFFAPSNILPLKLPTRIKKVLAVHDLVSMLHPETMASYNHFIHDLFFKQSVKSADHIITMSEYTKQSIIDYFHICADKITVIYEGVDEKFRPYSKNEVQEVLNRYGLKRPHILSVGTLEPRKNYPILLKAFKNLNIDYDLVIVGKEGWKAKSIFETIRRLKLEERVKILGYLDLNDLPYIYNGAELFVFPSIYEGFGLPLVEAMACGIPVVCSNASCLPEIGGDAVCYFNPQSVDELILKIREVLDSPQLQQSLRQKGINQAVKFNWDNTAGQTLAVLKGR